MENDIELIPDALKQLAEGFSSHNKSASIYWLAIGVVSTLVIMPTTPNGQVDLPFVQANVAITDFYPFAFILLSLLIIVYGSIKSHSIRVRKLIQRYIVLYNERQETNNPYRERLYLQDLFDSITSPGIAKVAPLAQIIQGKYQFYPEAHKRPLILSILGGIYFCVLRIIGILIIEIFPGYALFLSARYINLLSNSANNWKIPKIFFLIVGFTAAIIMFQLLILDIIYAVGSLTRICKKTTIKILSNE